MKRQLNRVKSNVNKAIKFVSVDIWRIPLKNFSPTQAFLIKQLRIVVLVLRSYRRNRVPFRATALTFYSLFSLVPLAVVGFAIARGFGLENYLLMELELSMEGREEVFDFLLGLTISFLDQFDRGLITLTGIGILFYTLIMLLSNVERSFNDIWNITRGRSWVRRFSDFLTMIFVIPILLSLVGLINIYLRSAAFQAGTPVFSPALITLVSVLPYLLTWAFLTLLYMVMPNTGVRFSAALPAGIIAGTALQVAQWAYIAFQVGVSRNSALYGSFAALPLLMIWLQASWTIVLVGAELSYAAQNVNSYYYRDEAKKISRNGRKKLCLLVMHALVCSFGEEKGALGPQQVAALLKMPSFLVSTILQELEEADLALRVDSAQENEAYVPALDPEVLTIAYVIEKLEKKGSGSLPVDERKELCFIEAAVEDFLRLAERSEQNLPLKDLPQGFLD